MIAVKHTSAVNHKNELALIRYFCVMLNLAAEQKAVNNTKLLQNNTTYLKEQSKK